jgi:hypothetical protein
MQLPVSGQPNGNMQCDAQTVGLGASRQQLSHSGHFQCCDQQQHDHRQHICHQQCGLPPHDPLTNITNSVGLAAAHKSGTSFPANASEEAYHTAQYDYPSGLATFGLEDGPVLGLLQHGNATVSQTAGSQHQEDASAGRACDHAEPLLASLNGRPGQLSCSLQCH